MNGVVDARFGCINRVSGKLVIYREPTHKPIGSPICSKCGIPSSRHRKAKPRKQRSREQERERAADKRREKRLARMALPIVGLDGEGEGRSPHYYTYISAVDETGKKYGSLYQIHGLSSEQILDWLVDLETETAYGFSLGYDFSMWLKDLPPEKIYTIVRPESNTFEDAKGRMQHRPVYWKSPSGKFFRFRYLRRRLEVARGYWTEGADPEQGQTKAKFVVQAKTLIWDVFAFYQCSFVKALENWKIGSESQVARILNMKEKRSEFENQSPRDIQAYCDEECQLLGKLVRKLIDSHETADLPLRSFYGAGSTSSALLKRMGVNDYKQACHPEMLYDCMRAFFGGRFELSRVGPVGGKCYGHDISSAYPYAMCFLPCLIHGAWRKETVRARLDGQIRRSTLALVNCEVRRSGPGCWGPLPFRDAKGNITFPLSLESTWVWKEEYLAAVDGIWPGVRPLQAWIYESDCDCQPFKDVSLTYLERLKLGKEGAGMVLKLGMNGGYGKLAQSQGSAPFQSFIWAGTITSNCRAQLLGAISSATDPANVLMLATDGVLASEKLKLPAPRDTETDVEYLDPNKKKMARKPLGGWEIDEYPNGIMLCRPGIYFPLDVNEEKKKKVKSRGISAKVLFAHSHRLVAHFAKEGAESVYEPVCDCTEENGTKAEICKPDKRLEHGVCTRFVGMKQGVGIGKKRKIVKRDNFCCWEDWPITVTFNPQPKRERARKDNTLQCWQRRNGESAVYEKGLLGSEGAALKMLTEIREEQPDGDLSL